MTKKQFPWSPLVLLAVWSLTVLGPMPAHASEGYFYQGFGPFNASFNLIGGQYELYVNARLPTSPFNTNAPPCIFGGFFERVSPNPDTMRLGPGAAITTATQYQMKPTLQLPAGAYHLKIATLTTCNWNFDIISTTQNKAGLASVQLLKKTGKGMEMANTISITDAVQFYASYRTTNSGPANVSGTLQIINGGRVVSSFPVRDGYFGRCNVFYLDLHWGPSDTKYLGRNIAKMIVKIGEEEFTTTTEFTLTQ